METTELIIIAAIYPDHPECSGAFDKRYSLKLEEYIPNLY